MNHGKEKAVALGSVGASVALAVMAMEGARVHGTYTVDCVGPKESERSAYVLVRDQIERLKAYGAERVTELAAAVQTLAAFVLEPKFSTEAPNLVTTVGGNLILDTLLAGSSYSVTGPYMFLINTNASAAAIGDTMASHAGWLEVGGTNAPAYTGARKTVAFSAASSKSKTSSAASSFAITSAGTVGGCGLVLGSGASSTVDNTGGVLYSAGAFTGGSKIVDNGDTLNVTYTASV